MKPKHCEKIAAFGDDAIAYVTALVVATRDVRADIMDVDQMSEPLHFFKRYKFYFLRHKQKRNNNRLQNCFQRKEQITQEYDPWQELRDKGLEDIICFESGNDMIDVRYFEATEHQKRKPMRCYFRNRDYMIDFGQSGTTWCGGMRGNGYVFKRGSDNTYQQIAIISPELSDYLAKIADEKMQSQAQRLEMSRGSH
ncbi:MAG: hypothetical protein J5613_00855 [Alphaproteobacteria bacterium]|nr:hypothetical protein [Alphaproteobacteria bacterium]